MRTRFNIFFDQNQMPDPGCGHLPPSLPPLQSPNHLFRRSLSVRSTTQLPSSLSSLIILIIVALITTINVIQMNFTFAVSATISSHVCPHILLYILLILHMIILIFLTVHLMTISLIFLLLSDLSSIGSVDQVTVMDSTFAAISAIPSPALVKHQKFQN